MAWDKHLGSYGPAGPCRSLITGEVTAADTPRGPVVITAGRNPNGTLRVHLFNSPAEAHAAGFTWAGRPTGRN